MNLRDIKKDIEYLIGSVVDDCNLYMSIFPGKNGEEAAGKIMNDAIELYNNLIDKVNNPDKSDPKKIKEHYRNIRKELNEGVDALCERLSSVAGEEKAE